MTKQKNQIKYDRSRNMDCMLIEQILSSLSVDSAGRIRGKSRCIDAIHSEHLKTLHSKLMDVRIFVSGLSTRYSTLDALKMIDEYIYEIQTKE